MRLLSKMNWLWKLSRKFELAKQIIIQRRQNLIERMIFESCRAKLFVRKIIVCVFGVLSRRYTVGLFPLKVAPSAVRKIITVRCFVRASDDWAQEKGAAIFWNRMLVILLNWNFGANVFKNAWQLFELRNVIDVKTFATWSVGLFTSSESTLVGR